MGGVERLELTKPEDAKATPHSSSTAQKIHVDYPSYWMELAADKALLEE